MPWQRWQVTGVIFEWACGLLERVLPPAGGELGPETDVTADRIKVVSGLMKNSGQLGDMHDSESARGLYSNAVDLIALGLTYSSIIAVSPDVTAPERDTSLRHLSPCIGAAVKMVSLAIRVVGGAGGADAERVRAAGGGSAGAEQEMLQDLRQSVLDVLCEGWATSPYESQDLEPSRVRAISSVLKYATLPSEPALSSHALRLLLLLSASAARNGDVVDAFLYGCNEVDRSKISRGLAAWLHKSLSPDERGVAAPGLAEQGAGVCDVAALVLRVLLRSLDALQMMANKHDCEPIHVVRHPADYGENLAVALMGLYQDHHDGELYQDPGGGAHHLLQMIMRVIQATPWPCIRTCSNRQMESAAQEQEDGEMSEAGGGVCVETEADLAVFQLSHDCMHIMFMLSSSGAFPPIRAHTHTYTYTRTHVSTCTRI